MDELDEVTSLEDEQKLANCVNQIVEKGKAMAAQQRAREVKKFAQDAPLFKTNLEQKRFLTGHHGKVYALQWASDSRHLLSAAQDGKLFLFDGYTMAKDVVFRLESPFVMCCAMNDSQKLAVCGGLDNTLSVFDVQEVKREQLQAAREHPSGDKRGEPKTAVKSALVGHDGYLSDVQFLSADNVITSSGDQTIIRWDLSQERKVTTFHGHLEDVSSVAVVDKQAGIFVSGSVDNTIKVWDARVPTPVITLYGHTAEVHTVATSGGLNGMIASCSDNAEDGSVRVWDFRAKAQLIQFQNEDPSAGNEEKKGGFVGSSAVAFTSTGRGLVAGFNDGVVRIFDVLTGLTSQTINFSLSKSRVSAVGVSPDGRAVAVAGWDTVYDPGNKKYHNGPGPVIYA